MLDVLCILEMVVRRRERRQKKFRFYICNRHRLGSRIVNALVLFSASILSMQDYLTEPDSVVEYA